MVNPQFGALTPVQHFNQQRQHQQPYNHPGLSFHTSSPPLPPPSSNALRQRERQQQQPEHARLTAGDATDDGSLHAPMHTPTQSTLIDRADRNPHDRVHTQNQARSLASGMAAAPDSKPHRGHTKKRRMGDEDGDERPLLPVPPRPPADPPAVAATLSKGPYNTMDDAVFALQFFVFNSGYGVSQKRTVKEKLPSGKYDPGGDIIRKDFACDKGGNEFVSQSRGERRRESKKCGCPWKAAIRRLRREGDRWFVEILDSYHNHPVTPQCEMETLASYRRWQRENNAGIRSAISRLTRAAAMPAREIAAYLRGTTPNPELDRIDKQILRALSMGDREVPGIVKDDGSVVFEMLGRRPVIILQDKQTALTTSAGSYPPPYPPPSPSSNQQPPGSLGGFSDLAAASGPFEGPAGYHHTFADVFASSSHAGSNDLPSAYRPVS